MTSEPEKIEAAPRTYEVSNSTWFAAALIAFTILCAGLETMIFFALKKPSDDCGCNRILIAIGIVVPVVLYTLVFLAPLGRWRINENGVEYYRFWRSKRALAWGDITQIRWGRGYTRLRGRGITIPVVWTSLNQKAPGPVELLCKKLDGSFDLTASPRPFDAISPRRLSLLALVAIPPILAVYFYYVRDPVGHFKMRYAFETLGFLLFVGLFAAAVFDIWRFQRANRKYFGWRDRIIR